MAASPVVSNQAYTVNPLLRPRVFFKALLRGGGCLIERGGFFNEAKPISGSKNTVVRDRVDLRVVIV